MANILQNLQIIILNSNILVLKKRIQAFAQLGAYLRSSDHSGDFFLEQIELRNPWYTRENVNLQLRTIGENLQPDKLTDWLSGVPDQPVDKTVGLILAGNLPLVGFHDIMCVLLTGFTASIKTSSEDAGLTHYVVEKLIELEPAFAEKIELVEQLKQFDLVIATGSNNSARYFDYYFGKYPHIIRKNRNSVAILSGDETPEELHALGRDIFDYFGMGCRSVSKLFVPQSYPLERLLDQLEPFAPIAGHTKYRNNYDFNKSLYLINKDPHLDNGFLLLREHSALSSPLAVVHYEVYGDLQQLGAELQSFSEDIQLVVTNCSIDTGDIPQFALGDAQRPGLNDYADNVNTLDFLIKNQ